MSERTPTVVFSGAPADVARARSLLADNGIPAEIEDDRTGKLSAAVAEGAGESAAKVVVPAEHADRARTLLEPLSRLPESGPKTRP